MQTAEPIVVNAALAGIGVAILWMARTVVEVRDRISDHVLPKLNEMTLLLTHEEVGVLARLRREEARSKRHSDALRALGADLHEPGD